MLNTKSVAFIAFMGGFFIQMPLRAGEQETNILYNLPYCARLDCWQKECLLHPGDRWLDRNIKASGGTLKPSPLYVALTQRTGRSLNELRALLGVEPSKK